MRIGLVPRLLPGRPTSTGSDDPLLESLGSREEINQAVLSGVIAAEPQRDRSRDGAPITVLLVSFTAPDQRAHHTGACCEIEILDKLADPHRRKLKAGMRVAVVGQLTGAGGLWALHIIASQPKPSPSR
jgi:primosomal replication protein N